MDLVYIMSKKSVKALKGDMKISHRESEFVVTITI